LSDYITTFSKRHFKILEPDYDEIDIHDIAHSLSMLTRANGHFPIFYSVGQHCVACAQEALSSGLDGKTALFCLLHDASEGYISDVTRPVKKYIPQYIEIEKRIQDAIYTKFAGKVPDETESKNIAKTDDALLYHEFYALMGERLSDAEPALYSRPVFETEPFLRTEKKYIDMFNRLTMNLI